MPQRLPRFFEPFPDFEKKLRFAIIRPMLSLTARQSFILNRVVDSFIETGHPVSSQAVASISPKPVSPATVRNEMGMLEEGGYLMQAHLSSGRIPTDRGYRHYVEQGLDTPADYRNYFTDLAGRFAARFQQPEDMPVLAEESAAVLSEMSRQLGLLVLPDQCEFPAVMTAQGLRYLIEQPECRDTAKLKPLISAIEEKKKLKEWIAAHAAPGRANAFIGAEHRVEDLNDYAIVTARYETPGARRTGAIAVIGLKRMAYARVIPVVSEMARLMGQALQRMEENR